MKQNLPALISFFCVTAFLEVLAGQGYLNESLVPAPSTVLQTLFEMRNDFALATWETLRNVAAGLTLSIFIGTSGAFVFSLSKLLKRAVLPFAIFFQTVPIIAIAPLLVIYFGFGAPTVIASSFIVSLFPIIANTLLGLESATPARLELFCLYRTSRLKTLLKLQVPSAYLQIYSGLRISTGLALIGAVAGEFVAGGGLGALIDTARTQQRVDIVFSALLLLSLLGLIFIGTLEWMHRSILRWRPFVPMTLG